MISHRFAVRTPINGGQCFDCEAQIAVGDAYIDTREPDHGRYPLCLDCGLRGIQNSIEYRTGQLTMLNRQYKQTQKAIKEKTQ